MRLLFVSHVSPTSGLIGGVRLWRFAEELTQRGHRVLLLCGGPGQGEDSPPLRSRLRGHDWRVPFLLPVPDGDRRFGHGQPGAGAVRRLAKRAETATTLAWRGGVFWRWRRRAEQAFDAIAEAFSPHLALATFGSLDALWIARGYSERYGVPWVVDVKDPMTRFVPRPFWGAVRRRCASAALVTLNAEVQHDLSAAVLGRSGAVVYSGADVATETDSGMPVDDEPFFVLCGSLYDDIQARELLAGCVTFLRGLSPSAAGGFRLLYCGVDGQRFVSLVAAYPELQERATCLGQVRRDTFLGLCRRSVANLYVATRSGFHHKAFELFAAERPVVVMPAEHPETVRIAAAVGADFHVCRDSEAVTRAFRSIWLGQRAANGAKRCRGPGVAPVHQRAGAAARRCPRP